MPYIKGKKLSKYLNKLKLKLQIKIMKTIGKQTAKLHNNNIIHGDLTTSNMILGDNSYNKQEKYNVNISRTSRKKQERDINNNLPNFQIFFIDFGLGFHSTRIEDRAVDIHLLKQALEAKHFKQWRKLFQAFLKGYKTSKNYKETIQQLKKVEARGRYKH